MSVYALIRSVMQGACRFIFHTDVFHRATTGKSRMLDCMRNGVHLLFLHYIIACAVIYLYNII